MRGPYKVINILPSGHYELSLLSESYGKTTQVAAQYMVPWKGEWCPETCAAFFNDDNELLEDNQLLPVAQGPGALRSMPLLDDPEVGHSMVAVAGPSGTTSCTRVVEDPLSGEAVITSSSSNKKKGYIRRRGRRTRSFARERSNSKLVSPKYFSVLT